MTALSIVYITFNAEQHLAASLQQSQRLTQDILLLDSTSTDQTLAIAAQYQAKVIDQAWLGFAAQKQLAIDSATHDWVLLLDADEVLSDAAIREIQAILTQDEKQRAAAYALPRQNWFMGKWIRHGSWWPDRVTRLFDRRQGRMKPVKVHECWESKGDVKVLQGVIKHYSYDSYEQLVTKANRYSTLAAEQLFAQGKQVGKWSPLTHAFASFIRLFILKQGFRDGIEGAAIAYTTALGSFLKYAKLQALQQAAAESKGK